MSKTTARLLIAAVVLLTASNWFYARRAKAAATALQSSSDQASCTSYIPKEWGDFQGSSSGFGLGFQDSSGTLRFVTNVGCGGVPPIALLIQRGTPK
jgi:hypothetical protein